LPTCCIELTRPDGHFLRPDGAAVGHLLLKHPGAGARHARHADTAARREHKAHIHKSATC
jgi:hypothetical protein